MEGSYKEKIIEKYSGGGEVHRAERTRGIECCD